MVGAQQAHGVSSHVELELRSMEEEVGPAEPFGSLESAEESRLDRSVARKMDLILLPFLALFFLVNSLDKSNVGNAETQHFTRDAGLSPGDLNTAVAFFFAFFVALQPVGAALGKRFGMVRWVPSCMIIWGFCTIAHIWIHAKWQLILARMIIGIMEAGFYPVTVSYMSMFYTRYEFARRLGIFYGQLAVAGAIGGLLSYAIFSAYPAGPDRETGFLTSWRMLFLIEGLLTICIAVAGYWFLPHSPETAWFLAGKEKVWAGERIRRDRDHQIDPADPNPGAHQNQRPLEVDAGDSVSVPDGGESEGLLAEGEPSQNPNTTGQAMTKDAGLTILDIISAFSDWKIWYLLVVNILSAIPTSAFSVFLPLVVEGFGVSGTVANLFTVPPFLAGAIVLWTFTWWSDRRQERLIPIIYGLAILLIGLTAVVMLPHDQFIVRYIALCVLLGGSFIASPLTVSWLANNVVTPGKRAIVLGINGWGNLAGVLSALIFTPKYAPYYITPFFVTLSLVVTAFVGFLVFRWLIVRENAKRSRLVSQWSLAEKNAERRWGLGPAPQPSQLIQRCVLPDRFFANQPRGRQGEERKTYLYGL